MNITRRQFLQYCTASAAALGLSQLDLLKLEKALGATVCGSNDHGAPHVIWFQGQSCGGCTLSILNRMPIDSLKAGHDVPLALDGPGAPVQDIVDLLVGDAVSFVTGATKRTGWGDFPKGYITLDYQSEVVAGAGDLIADYIECLRNSGTPYFVGLSGAIPLVDQHYLLHRNPTTKEFNVGQPFCVSGSFDTAGSPLDDGSGRVERSIAEIIPWLATGSGFSGLVCFGTCASFGGIPSAKGNWTAATGAYNYIVNKLNLGNADLDTIAPNNLWKANGITGLKLKQGIINVPGCPPHPDWMIYPVAYILLGLLGVIDLAPPPLDDRYFTSYTWWQHDLVYAPQVTRNTPRDIYTADKGYQVFCDVCDKYTFNGNLQCYDLGAGKGNGDLSKEKEWCTRPQGCNGYVATPDCPTRRWNNFDDHSQNNWCVGTNYVCQGCAEPDFPDGRSPFFSGAKYFDGIG